jgi:heat shock protein HslJ
MNIRTSRLLALLAAPLLLLASCGSQTADGPGAGGAADAPSGPYLSTTVTVDGQDHPLVDGKQIRLVVDNGQLALSAGCNQMGGPATWSGDTVTLGVMAMTEMGCAEPLMAQDAWIADFFSGTLKVATDGDDFTLTKDGTAMTFTPEIPPAAAPLAGTRWTLTSIGSGGSPDATVSSVPAGVDSGFQIDGDQISIWPGCNTGSGKVVVGDSTISATRIATTMMACTDERGDVEQEVLAFFNSGSLDFVIDGDTLTLTASDGKFLTYVVDDSGSGSGTTNPDPSVIQGITWNLTQISTVDGDTATGGSIPADVTASLELHPDMAFVNTGCNRGRGRVDYAEGSLTITALALTKMACRGPAADVDAAVHAVLGTDAPATWTFDGTQLVVSTPDGSTSLTYEAAK